MDIHDATILARFASGELSLADENRLLIQCEVEPGLWRKAALALVEHRRITDGLAEYSGSQQHNSRGQGSRKAADPHLWHRGWRLAAAASLLFVIIGSIAIAYRTGQQHAQRADALPEESARPIVVYITQPAPAAELQAADDSPGSGDELMFAAMQPVFPPEAQAILRDLGFEVEEEAQIQFVDGNNGHRRAISGRSFQLRHVDYSE